MSASERGTVLRSGSIDDLVAILMLFDDAVTWLVANGRAEQWGSDPWSVDPAKIEFIRRMLEHGETTMAMRNGTVVGAMILSTDRIAYAPAVAEPEVYVQLLITSRVVRGGGVGSVLLSHARSETRKRNIDLLRVDCWAGGDRRLVQYYIGAGFTPTVEVPVRNTCVQVFEQRLKVT